MTNSNYTLGLSFAFLVVAIWTAASFFTQYLQTSLKFKGVFLFTYLSSSLFSLNFIVWYVSSRNPLFEKSSVKSSSNSLVNSYKTLEENDNPILNEVGEVEEDFISSGINSINNKLKYSTNTGGFNNYNNNKNNNNNNHNDNSNGKTISTNYNSSHTEIDDYMPETLDISPISPMAQGGESSPSKSTENIKCAKGLYQIPLFRWLMQPIPVNYTHTDLFYTSLLLMPLWFIGNFFYNYSLLYTSIGSSMVITELNGALTLIFSYIFGVENATFSKLLGVILSFSGVVLVSWGDSENTKGDIEGSSVYGDIMALIGAIGYGLYTTFLKIKIPESSNNSIPSSLLFGYFGLAACIGFFPVMIYFLITNSGGVSDLTPFVFGYIFVEEIFDAVLANYLYAKATILTTPTVTAVSVTMTVPSAIVADFLYAGIKPSTSQIIGAVLVTLGVIMVSINNNVWIKVKRFLSF